MNRAEAGAETRMAVTCLTRAVDTARKMTKEGGMSMSRAVEEDSMVHMESTARMKDTDRMVNTLRMTGTVRTANTVRVMSTVRTVNTLLITGTVRMVNTLHMMKAGRTALRRLGKDMARMEIMKWIRTAGVITGLVTSIRPIGRKRVFRISCGDAATSFIMEEEKRAARFAFFESWKVRKRSPREN